MTGKVLGKIDFAEFGTIKDYPFLIGLQLGFKFGDGGAIMDGSTHTVNIDKQCRWEESDRLKLKLTETHLKVLEF